jgi:16S rRNA (adenine1518-N6/adenine1519-N6)-dimethyltransferase
MILILRMDMSKKKETQGHGMRLGQHFLFDEGILNRIADSAEITGSDNVLEVGPGLGTLTQCLAERAGRVVAVELDRALAPRFAERMAAYDNVSLVNADIMRVDLREIWHTHFESKPFKVVANLPYYITTPVIMLFLESGLPVQSITVLVQKEVADRLVSPPGSREYGAISVAVQYRTVATRAFIVPAEAFTPPPRVQSAVLHMVTRDTPPVDVGDVALFEKTVRGCFSSRRKTLRNNIISVFGVNGDEAIRLLQAAGLDPTERAERLGLQQFADLTNTLASAGYNDK